ncbi:hypothetical protein AB205_0057780, partial [Aquarana catesbeiana]
MKVGETLELTHLEKLDFSGTRNNGGSQTSLLSEWMMQKIVCIAYDSQPHSKFKVPPSIRCSQQSAPFHQVSPSEYPLPSGVPIRVPPSIRCPHHSAPFHQVSSSEFPLTSGVFIRVPPFIRCLHQSAPLHQVSSSECSLPSGAPSRVPLYLLVPG